MGRGYVGAVTDPVTEPLAVRIDPGATVERLDLGDGAWVDVARGWLAGADVLFDALLHGVAWETSRLFRYDHWVEERRLGSMWRSGMPMPHPALADVHRTLQHRYRARSSTGSGSCSTATVATARPSTATPTCDGSTTPSSRS